ncbi:MAG: hypothetical protein U9N82_08435 [Thermodesulfobacteriota bacterium]|nr:hypothetical protein [Thermodesulfobacteriota bacterium]
MANSRGNQGVAQLAKDGAALAFAVEQFERYEPFAYQDGKARAFIYLLGNRHAYLCISHN